MPNTYYWSALAPELGLSLKGIPIDQARNTAAKYGIDIDASTGTACVCEDLREREGENEEGDAMMLMANEGNLEDLVSMDVLQCVSNLAGDTLNESRLCKGLLPVQSIYKSGFPHHHV